MSSHNQEKTSQESQNAALRTSHRLSNVSNCSFQKCSEKKDFFFLELTVVTVLTVMTVLTVVTKQLCTPKHHIGCQMCPITLSKNTEKVKKIYIN